MADAASAPLQSDGGDSSQHSELCTFRGTQPGLLDLSQPTRLLRFPDSKLSFAAFDPKTALVEEPDIRKRNSTESLTPPKRIVIETMPKGASFWRFVPPARLDEGVQDEGVWPRCPVLEEQWEIYKLDPVYQCVVYLGRNPASSPGLNGQTRASKLQIITQPGEHGGYPQIRASQLRKRDLALTRNLVPIPMRKKSRESYDYTSCSRFALAYY
ncbi:hypothetical protein BU15DRAFT_67370 [Melanogaster broomeanus]|nr:hypothetical protein BU15DRAFT_67370 [Melanogaster broomeanus]